MVETIDHSFTNKKLTKSSEVAKFIGINKVQNNVIPFIIVIFVLWYSNREFQGLKNISTIYYQLFN